MQAPQLFVPAFRAVRVQVRTDGLAPGQFWARVMAYEVPDDYNTIFGAGLFAESLRTKLPKVVWAHDWSEPLGRYIDANDTRDSLDLLGEFDLGMIDHLANDGETVLSRSPAVPRAHQAHHQLGTGTIDEFSVGFLPQDGEMAMIDERDYFRFTRARLDEASLVLAGAVPGTELLAVRSRGTFFRSPVLVVSKDLAAQTILGLHNGTIDLADALQAIKQGATEATDDNTDDGDPPSDDGADPPDPPADPPTPIVDPPEPASDLSVDPVEPDLSDLDDIDGILSSLTH